MVRGAKSTRLDKARVARKGGFGSLVRTLVVPRVSRLFEGKDGKTLGRDHKTKRVSNFMAPVNQGLEQSEGNSADGAGAKEGGTARFDYRMDSVSSEGALGRQQPGLLWRLG